MQIKINRKIIKETTMCSRDFVCLIDPNKIPCKVEECIGKEVYFVKCLHYEICSYRVHYGEGCICACPIRKEIFRKYKI